MTRAAKTALIAVFAVLILGAVAITAGAWAVYNAVTGPGAMRVHVTDHRSGDRVAISLPSGIVNTVLRLTPVWGIDVHDDDVEQWGPALQAMAAELDRIPDAVLVEVHDGDQHVQISKRNGGLMIDVTSPDEEVHVQLPPETMRIVGRKIARLRF
ncbi:MAG: hypothetical protein WBX15_08370 [Thermoanaerobaculia bacterium]